MNAVFAHDTLRPYGATVLRMCLGIVFVAHALSKPFYFTFPGTVAFFEANGFPGWTAYPVFVAELIGGLLLIAGVHTGWVALALLPVTAGALLVHASNGWLFISPGGGWEYPAFLMGALSAQSLLGDGKLAVRDVIRQPIRVRSPSAPRTA